MTTSLMPYGRAVYFAVGATSNAPTSGMRWNDLPVDGTSSQRVNKTISVTNDG